MQSSRRMAELCIRLGTVFLMAGLLLALPDSLSEELLRLKNTSVAGIIVFGLGKVLFDSFYDEGEL